MNQPLVSICIPTYNGEKFIAEALYSAINQTYRNIEIIISDDASNDSTLKIVNEIISNSNRPFAVYNHKPSGIGTNWNNCIRKAKGEYIKFLFQDDLLRVDCVEKMIALAMLNKNIGLVYCKRIIIHDPNNQEHLKWIQYCGILHKYWYKLDVKEGFVDGKDYLSDLNLMYKSLNKIGEPTAVLLNKAIFKKIGYFDKNLRQSLDIEFWYRVMKFFKLAFADDELVSFRLHDLQATFINKNNQVDEKYLLEESLYRNVFWQLHPKRRWKLFKSHSKIGDLVRFLKKLK